MSPALAFMLVALTVVGERLDRGPGGGVRSTSTQQPPARPTFGTEIEVVEVDVAVTRNGHPVLGLKAEDFEVRDNGVVQDVRLVGTGEMPVSVVLVLDTSASMAGGKLAQLRAAAKALLAGLRPGDRAGLVTFSQTVRVRSRPTQDLDMVRSRLDQTVAWGLTALNDALYAGLSLVQGRRERSAVVLFTDGADNISWLGNAEVLSAARQADPLIYAVTMIPEGSGPVTYTAEGGWSLTPWVRSQRLTDPREAVLRKLADATGGGLFPTRQSELTDAFLQVLGEMRTRYLLSYVPVRASEEGWHELEVSLRGHKGDVRARQGYLRLAPGGPR